MHPPGNRHDDEQGREDGLPPPRAEENEERCRGEDERREHAEIAEMFEGNGDEKRRDDGHDRENHAHGRIVHHLLFALILAAFTFLHLHRQGEVSITWDEGGDLGIVECIQKNGPFACLVDISQTRLPFLIHAAAGPAWENRHRPHYQVSLIFNLLTLIVLYAFARRGYGAGVATLTAALYATSIQVLASGRMLLSHGNIVFAFFSTASFVAILLFAREGRWRWLPLCAIASGCAAASHPLGLFNGLAILAVYLTSRRFAWRDLAFFPIAAATFFASSVIYVKPENFLALAKACTTPGNTFPYWNYLGTGATTAPWWFPWLMTIVKIGPWWLLLAAACAFRARLDRQLTAFLLGFAANLVLKGAVFHYETPHHQVQWYAVLLLAIAVLIVRAWNRWVMVAVATCFAIQLVDVVRFFPHYLFYGSQYGERFVGEFYGPAVMHAQGRDPLNRAIDRILMSDPAALILVADNNILGRNDPRVVPFTKRDPNATYQYAFVDRLYGVHFRFPERDAFNELLAREYEPYWTYYFPPRMWVYRIYRRRF
jgi:hypothetical protein